MATESTSMTFDSLKTTVSLWWKNANDTLTGKAEVGALRSPQWPKARAAFLKDNPVCECCGGKEALEVHHLEPFSINPAKELDPANMMTLCESKKYGLNCHLLVGHLGNYSRFNPLAKLDAMIWRAKLSGWLSDQLKQVFGK